MKRGRRERRDENNFKYLVYLSGGIVLVILITFAITFVVYNNKLKNSSYSSLTTEKIAELVPNDIEQVSEELEEASTQIGKTIDEAIKSIEENKEETKDSTKEIVKQEKQEEKIETTNADVEKERKLEFCMPVDGEIMRNYAKESLIYSETLEEWITHLGIDIKAERTTVVKSAEEGEILSIKNDPRYGLTIVIEHSGGFKTVYSNLLSTEFVSEGEKVDKGQSIGTVGNSASFEIVDEPHLHFEIVKDNENVDPNIYLK